MGIYPVPKYPATRALACGWSCLVVLWASVSAQSQENATIFAGNKNWLAISNRGLWAAGTNQPAGGIGGIATLGKDSSTNLFLTYRLGAETNWRSITGMGDSKATTFGLRTDGSLWAWGDNSLGQLGDGTGADSKVPVRVSSHTNWKSVSAADGKVFALKTDGTLWAWGENRLNTGALGIGRGRDNKQYLPVEIGSGKHWRSISAGGSNQWFAPASDWLQLIPIPQVHLSAFTVVKGAGGAAVTSNGELWFWGNALSVATNFSPIRFGSDNDWKQIVFGPRPYALKNDGTLWQFQFTQGSQAGLSSNNYIFSNLEDFRRLPGDTNQWASLHASGYGYVSSGINGYSHVVSTNVTGEIDVFFFTGHVLGIQSNGSLWSWGNNDRGQLGIGTLASSPAPQQVGTDTNWVEISAGPYWSMAKKADGSLWAWGDIGGDVDPYVKTPTRVGEDNDWLTAVAGSDYSLAVKTDGRVFACGNTDLPSGGLTNPGGVLIQTNFTNILSGGTNRTDSGWGEASWTNGLAAYRRKIVAIATNGALRIWGDAFGDYPEDGRTNLPTPIPDDLDSTRPWWDPERYEPGVLSLAGPWIAVTGNSGTTNEGSRSDGNTLPAGFAAAVRADGTLWAWGANPKGQLGDGTRIPKDLPIRIGAGTNRAKVEAGGGHLLAMQKDGSVWAWGGNDRGEFGAKATNVISTLYNSNVISIVTNISYDIRFAPVRVISNVITNMEVTPYTLSQLEFDTNALVPRNILPASWGARDISAGGANSLILKSDGSLWELGRAPTGNTVINITNLDSLFPKVVKAFTNIRVAPVQIYTHTNYFSGAIDLTFGRGISNVSPTGATWRTMAAGDRHNLAVRSDRTLWAWGENESAQLGDGGLTGTNRPVKVGAGNRWKQVFAGSRHSLAIKDDGSLWAWGLNDGRLSLPFATAQSFHEPTPISFGSAGLATMIFENGKTGTAKISGQGLAAFSPANGRAILSAQIVEGILGPARRRWEGQANFRFAGHQLIFSNAYLGPLVSNEAGPPTGSIGLTNSNPIPREAFVRLEWAVLERSQANPALYQGEARLVWVEPSSLDSRYNPADRLERLRPKSGTICRVSFLLDRDQDSDGIPDMADSAHRGAPPVITSTNRLRLIVGSGARLPYQVTTAPNPLSGGARILANEDLSALPPGLFYTTNGFGGVPEDAAVGNWEVVVGARNDAGESYRTILLEIFPPAPQITSAGTVNWRQGTFDFSYRITATNTEFPGYPVRYTATQVPAGLSVNPTTGWIRPVRSGQLNVPAPGLYRWTLMASNRAGVGTKNLEVSVEPPGTGGWVAGVPVSYAVQLAPGATYTLSGLPAGLSFNPSSGLITGVPRAAGQHEVVIVSRVAGTVRTNRVSFAVRPGRPEIVGPTTLSFTGAHALTKDQFFRYAISARSAGQTWAGASDFATPLSSQWSRPAGIQAGWTALSNRLCYGWTGTNEAFASLDWHQPLPLDTGWQVSVNAAFSTNNLSGFLQNQESLSAMLVALKDASLVSASNDFVSVYLEASSVAPSGEVFAEAMVGGVAQGPATGVATGGKSTLSLVYQPWDATMISRADKGDPTGLATDFQTNTLVSWAPPSRTNGLILRLMGQSEAPTHPAAPYPYFTRFVVTPLGDLAYYSSNLPAGLTLDSATGLIQGIPTNITNLQTSTVVVSNSLGTTNLTIRFKINP